MFKKGEKVRLLVHGAGVTSEETGVVESVTKNAIKLENEDRLYNPKTGHSEVGFAGFWFEIQPLKKRAKGK